MADFQKALPIILAHEGGYVDNPSDPGGETNRGITMGTFQASAKRLLGIEPTSENLKQLTPQQAGLIYKKNYWDRMRGDEYVLQDLANIVCDFYVNAGTAALKLLQRNLRDAGATLYVDGVIGDATMWALTELNPSEQKMLYNAYKAGRIDYYQSLAEKYPMFLKGWLNRVNSFPDL